MLTITNTTWIYIFKKSYVFVNKKDPCSLGEMSRMAVGDMIRHMFSSLL